MPYFEKIYYLFKLGSFLLFCFVGGGWLIYDGIAEKRGQVTFDGVFPGAAAITAGLLAVGLLYYLRRSSRSERRPSAPSPSSSDAVQGTAPDPVGTGVAGKPWLSVGRTGERGRPAPVNSPVPSAKWFELTPMRRQLILAGFVALGVIGSAVLWTYQTGSDLRNRVDATWATSDAEARERQARLNTQFLQRQAIRQALEGIEQILDIAQKFARTAEKSYPHLGAVDGETQKKLDEAFDGVVVSLHEQQARLDGMKRDEALTADHARVEALRARCSTLIERLAQVRAKGGDVAPGKE